MRVRAVLKLRNEKMLAAKESLGMTHATLVQKSGVQLRDVFKFVSLDWTVPNAEAKATALAAVLGIPVDDVLPEGMAGKSIQSKHTRTFDAPVSAMLASNAADRMCLPAPSESFDQGELQDLLRDSLASLTYRHREILKMRFGLEGTQPFTLEECAKVFGVTREVIRQHEAKALRKVQEISGKKLSAFVS